MAKHLSDTEKLTIAPNSSPKLSKIADNSLIQALTQTL